MKTVRIYGFLDDHGSFAQVTRGFREGLLALGHSLIAAEFTDQAVEQTLDVVSLEHEPSFDEEPSGLPLADVAILTGPPVAAGRLTSGVRHETRLVMVHPNSDKLPQRMMQIVNEHATHLLTASAWGATVLREYTGKPVIVVPLGVSEGFRSSTQTTLPMDEFRILHLSSTEGERKGTKELCRAFLNAKERKLLPSPASLLLVLTPGAVGGIVDELADLGTDDGITISTRFGGKGFDPESMRAVYASHHLVCQPSRGEGFGLVPLEALTCGTPIVATRCTGHSEWFTDDLKGAVPVPTGEPVPIDDMPNAKAPSLRVEDLVQALSHGYELWRTLKEEALEQAPHLREKWTWKAQLGAHLAELLS